MKAKLLFFFLLSSLLSACQKDPEIISLSGKTMGTTYHIRYIEDDSVSENSQKTHEQIDKRCFAAAGMAGHQNVADVFACVAHASSNLFSRRGVSNRPAA